MNKQKIIVSTLALAMGAALAGSVSGTVAWFQYSTRAQATYIGSTAHCSEALEVQATKVGVAPLADAAKWVTELSDSDIAAVALDTTNHLGDDIVPISTTGDLAANAALPTYDHDSDAETPAVLSFTKNPIYQVQDAAKWGKATAANYVQFDLHFRVKDINGANEVSYLAKNVYLTNLSIVSLTNENADNSTDLDLYKAIRVHISDGTNHRLYANGSTSTVTHGNLDLNNDGSADKTAAYAWEAAATTIDYGAGTQSTYNAAAANVLADDSDPYNITANNGGLGQTKVDNSEGYYKVTVTIWLEGWQELADPANADAKVWEPATYIGKKFGVGMRFAVAAHTAH